ncbi:MAG: shikimate 5-dehydrogenase [Acidobacteria bacterium OLB17]|nr:MAG: shikimate 5-dehydrogenase [Acidobacteria bacterium OLB17]MCZ2391337.1 shikimate dehydrogenase [Acidobacteriota bacterium]
MNPRSKICIAIAPKGVKEFASLFEDALAFSPGFVEIRFDAAEPSELPEVVKMAAANSHLARLIATFRPRAEGGFREISDEERQAFWSGLPSGFWAFDVESDAVPWADHENKIVSRHDFERMPANIDKVFDELADRDTRAVKVAAMADDTHTAIPAWKTLLRASERKRDAIVIAMGDAGKWTRVLGPSRGALLTYASLDEQGATASGQVSARELRDLYRVDEIDADTRIYGVIGDPIRRSLSPRIHNPLFRNATINAVFLPFLVKDLGEFIARFVRPDTQECGLAFGGLSVTMPHKLAIIELLDELDGTAREAGAVNTVKVVGGRLIGYNTDIHGFLSPLKRRRSELKGVRAAVIGAGGAARACISALAGEGAEITVFARRPEAASELGDAFDIGIEPLGNGNELARFDVLVNATPIGMNGEFEHQSPVPDTAFSSGQTVFDLVTKPSDTPFIADAKRAGAETIPGIEMLISQGLKQFEIWTGIAGDEDAVRRSLAEKNGQVS